MRAGAWGGLAALVLAACGTEAKGDEGASAAGTPGAAAPAALEAGAGASALLERLEGAGLAVGRFAAEADTPCRRGPIEGLEVLVCPESPDVAARAARFLDGAVSGARRTAGGWTLVAADRDKSDPNGKRLDKLLKAFASGAQ